MKLTSFSGASRIHYDGSLNFLSDLILVMPNDDLNGKESDTFSSFKEDQFRSNPYIAPEFFYTEITNRTPYIDSWSLGTILFFLIFGEDPPSVWKNFPAGDISKNTKEPSDYY